MIRNEGGLWDTAFEVFPNLNAVPTVHNLTWTFPSRARVRFAHLEAEDTVHDWQGAQVPLICFDELTHFTEKQFFYMLSRNRSTCGVQPYMRASTNPDPKSWVRKFISWWIDEATGYPVPERSGVVRYFVRDESSSAIVWVGPEHRDADGNPPTSVTFIPAKLDDNPSLVRKDPKYRARLASLSRVDRLRLLGGNWNVSEEQGLFESGWFDIVDSVPAGYSEVRYWDMAGTEPNPKNPDPDWTAGVRGFMAEDDLYLTDMVHFREEPAKVETRIKAVADRDGQGVEVLLEQEPGSAGKAVISHYVTRVLRGFVVNGDRPTGDKVHRAKTWAGPAEHKRVHLLRGPWNQALIDEAVSFPHGKKDQVDAVSGLYAHFNEPMPGFY